MTLYGEIAPNLTEGQLDDIVHELKSEEAAAINNSGKEAQVDFIQGKETEPWAAELAAMLGEITSSLEDDHQSCPWCEDESWYGPDHMTACKLGRAKKLLARIKEGEETPALWVNVYVRGGVAEVGRSGTGVRVEVLDYDNDGCNCAPGGESHSHEILGP